MMFYEGHFVKIRKFEKILTAPSLDKNISIQHEWYQDLFFSENKKWHRTIG